MQAVPELHFEKCCPRKLHLLAKSTSQGYHMPGTVGRFAPIAQASRTPHNQNQQPHFPPLPLSPYCLIPKFTFLSRHFLSSVLTHHSTDSGWPSSKVFPSWLQTSHTLKHPQTDGVLPILKLEESCSEDQRHYKVSKTDSQKRCSFVQKAQKPSSV